jgi:hypothetical protein
VVSASIHRDNRFLQVEDLNFELKQL